MCGTPKEFFSPNTGKRMLWILTFFDNFFQCRFPLLKVVIWQRYAFPLFSSLDIFPTILLLHLSNYSRSSLPFVWCCTVGFSHIQNTKDIWASSESLNMVKLWEKGMKDAMLWWSSKGFFNWRIQDVFLNSNIWILKIRETLFTIKWRTSFVLTS